MANEYLDTLRDGAPVATGAGDNQYLRLLQGDSEAQRAAAAGTVSQALDTNPDQHAARVRAARYLGYEAPGMALAPDIERQAQLQRVRNDTAQAPVLQRKYTNADFAALAHDDSSTLKKVEQTVGGVVRYVMGASEKGGLAGDVKAGYHHSSAALASTFRAVTETASYPFDFLENVNGMGGNPFRRLSEGFKIIADDQNAKAAKSGGEVFGVSSGVQSLTANAKYTPLLAFGPAGAAAALAGMVSESFGTSYKKGQDAGLSHFHSVLFAGGDAAVEYWTEKLPMDQLVGALRTGAPFLQTLSRQMLLEIPGEQIATVLQDMNEWASIDRNKGKTFSEYIKERPSKAAETLIATVVGTGGNVVLLKAADFAMDGYMQEGMQRAQGEHNVRMINSLLTAAAGAKLRQRSPEQFRAFVEEVNPDGKIYIDGAVLNQMPEQVRALLPEQARAEIQDAAAAGYTVGIPLADILTTAPGTPLEQIVREHGRLAPDMMTATEMADAQGQGEQWLQQEAERVIGEAADQDAMRQSYENVKTGLLDQLNKVGRFSPAVNETKATYLANFYASMAALEGLTPEQMAARFPISFSGQPTSPYSGQYEGFTPEEVRMARDFELRAGSDLKIVDDYLSRFGAVVDPDQAKMMSAAFEADPALARVVHEGSSVLAKRVFQTLLRRNPPGKPVVFTAGGSGSGKSEAMAKATEVAGVDPQGVVYDSVLSSFDSARKKIDQTLASGAPVHIVYTNRHVEDAFRFAMQRPRVVTVPTIAHAHVGASDTIRRLAAHYSENPNVRIVVVDNNGDLADMKLGSIDNVHSYRYDVVERRLYEIAREALEAGAITPERYAALDPRVAGEGRRGDGAADRGLQAGVQRDGLGASSAGAGSTDGAVSGRGVPGPELDAGAASRLLGQTGEGQGGERPRVVFEVAPSPAATRLTEAWMSLPAEQRQEISRRVAAAVVPGVLEKLGAAGDLKIQVGSYMDLTNPSFALRLNSGDPLAVAKALGFTLSQESMVVVSGEQFAGGTATGAIELDVGGLAPAEIDALYQQLRAITVNGTQPIGGQSTVDGRMVILNFSDVSTEELAQLVDKATGGRFDVRQHDVYSAFPEQKDYDYGSEQSNTGSDAGAVREWVRAARAEANQHIRRELENAGAGGVVEQTQRGRTGAAAADDASRGPGAVDVTGIHFSRGQRPVLDGRYFGTGLKGVEQTRLAQSTDRRIRERVYFYVDEGNGVRAESGTGGIAHKVDLTNLYNVQGDPLHLFNAADLNASESRVLDAGFSGYYFPNYANRQGIAVVMGEASRGMAAEAVEAPRAGAPVESAVQPYRRALLSRELKGMDLSPVQAVAPSANVSAGIFSVLPEHLDAARSAMAMQGIDLPGPAAQLLGQRGDTTDTPAFRKWFGDSKVVDAQGKPLVVYRGDRAGKTEFSGRDTGAVLQGNVFFTSKQSIGEKYARGGELYATYLSLKNPLIVDAKGESWSEIPAPQEVKDEWGDPDKTIQIDYLAKWAREQGYDGLVVRDVLDQWGDGDQYIAFRPEQIKSATGNNGNFDPNDSNILNQSMEQDALQQTEFLQQRAEAAGHKTIDEWATADADGFLAAATEWRTQHPVEALGQSDDTPRGTFNPATFETTLGEDSNLSTFFHETGHFFLEVMSDISSRADAPVGIRQDMEKVLAWFGVKSNDAWRDMTLEQKRKYHERWAEAHEEYLLEGKAPTPELQPLFRRVSAWMSRVYRSLKQFIQKHPNEGMVLSDEIRSVFDRLLSSHYEVQTAEQTAGMQRNEDATATAVEKLTARMMRDMKWLDNAKSKALKNLQNEADSLRREMRDAVRAELMEQPVYAAERFLRTGEIKNQTVDGQTEEIKATKGHRLNSDALAEMYPASALSNPNLDRLKGLTAKNGLHPDLVAGIFGMRDGDQLVREIAAAEPLEDAVRGLVDQRMLEEHGELVDERALQEAANAAVHNTLRAKVLAAELVAQRDAMNPREQTGRTDARGRPITVNGLVKAAEDFAKGVVGRATVKDLKGKSWEYTMAERRAAKAWEKATAAGDTAAAVKAKQDQLLNNAIVREFDAASAEMRKIADLFRRVAKGSNEKTVERGRDPDVVNAARAVLAAYGYETSTTKAAGEYMEAVKSYDPAMYEALKPSVDGALQNAQPMTALSMDEMRALHEEIGAMWHLAKRSRQLEVNGNLMDIEDAAAGLKERMEAIGVPDALPGELRSWMAADEAKLKLQYLQSFMRRIPQWAEALDGATGGPFSRYVVEPLVRAATAYRTARVEQHRKYKTLVEALEPHLRRGVIEAPELNYTFGKDGSLQGHMELVHALLHTGNESNKRKLLLGRKWATQNQDGTIDTTRWDTFVDRMQTDGYLTKAHYDFAQGVWDMLEEMKPLAQRAHRDAFGRYFAEVTADSFSTPWGAYRGGYVPAQADPRNTETTALHAMVDGENASMQFAFPTTNKGFTKSRTEFNRPLLLDLNVIPQHMDKVLLFSHMEVPTRAADRLLRDRGVAYELGRLQPGAYAGMLRPWLNRTAKQQVESPVMGDGRVSRIFSTLRSRAGIGIMMANIPNVLQQTTGFISAYAKAKTDGLQSSILRSTADFMRNPKAMIKSVTEASDFMRNRVENEISAIDSTIKDILLDASVYEKAENWTRKHAYFLQSAMANTMEPIIWTAAYNAHLEKHGNVDDAVYYADGMIRQTQGSTLPEDVSRLESGPAFVRMFTQFSSYFNMLANTNATALIQTARSVGLKHPRALFIVTMGMLMPMWVAESIALAMRGGPEDEDRDGWLDDWLWAVFGKGTLKGATGAVPGAGPLSQLVVNRFNANPADDRMSLSPAVSILESAASAPKSVYDAMVEGKRPDKAVRDVASLITVTTGLPASAAAKPISYLTSVESGRVNPTGPVDAVRGTVTGTASPESRGR